MSERNLSRDRQVSSERALDVERVVGGAGGGGSPETILWETQSDWDGAVSSQYAIHPTGTIKMGIAPDGFEDYSTGVSGPGSWVENTQNLAVTSSEAYEGSQSWGGFNDNTRKEYLSGSGFEPFQYEYPISFVYKETTNNTMARVAFTTSSGDDLFDVGPNNPQVAYDDSGGYVNLVTDPTPSYGEWRRFTLSNWDWGARTVDVLWEDITGSTADASDTITFRAASTDDLAEIRVFHQDNGGWGGGASVEFWLDNLFGITSTASLTTATKSFSSAATPDLESLSYALNGGSIDVTAIGSPGAAGEERVTATLSGSSSVSLSWANSHTDFRLKFDLSLADPTNVAPELGRAGLAG